MLFDEGYYKAVIAEYGYDPFELLPIDFGLGSISPESLNGRWLCHRNGNSFAAAVRQGQPCILTTGVGLSGPPHIGTISQILKAILLQRAGLNVQLVLGDLDAYNARAKSYDIVVELADKYAAFAVALGFDPERGILRNQRDHPDVLRTAYLISQCVGDADFAATEEDISSIYIEHGVYKGIDFPVKLAILLMVADFIHLLKHHNHVMVFLGLDEHRYVRLAESIRERIAIDGDLSAMYSRVMKGFRGLPKMSKSIPGSGITADMAPDVIRDMILHHEGPYEDPLNSVVFQMMCSASDYTPDQLAAAYLDCEAGGSAWKKRKAAYIDILINICAAWPQ